MGGLPVGFVAAVFAGVSEGVSKWVGGWVGVCSVEIFQACSSVDQFGEDGRAWWGMHMFVWSCCLFWGAGGPWAGWVLKGGLTLLRGHCALCTCAV